MFRSRNVIFGLFLVFIFSFLVAIDFSFAAEALTNKLNTDDPNVLISNIINTILGVIGTISLLMFVYGGFTWMTSSGSPEKIKKGKSAIIWSVIGLATIFFSYALVNLVIFDIIGG